MRFVIIVILIFLNINLFSQLPIPELCAISVDTSTKRPVLYWSISDTTVIDGYIIKRIIWNGMGVLDGTLNNIAVIDDPRINTFVDTTTTYFTSARPDLRNEQYVITSYKDTLGTQLYSGFSQKLETIYLIANYDSCQSYVKLTWSTNQQIETYNLYLITTQGLKLITSTNDTEYIYKPLHPGFYRFLVSGKLSNSCLVDTINSNIAESNIDFLQRPQLLYIQGISAIGEDSLLLNIHILLPEHKPQIELWMDNTKIEEFYNDFTGEYIVNTGTGQRHNFILRAYSICNEQIDSSNIAYNIVLQANYEQSNTDAKIFLNWLNYNYSYSMVQSWDIYWSEDAKNYQWLGAVDDTVFTHRLTDLIIHKLLSSSIYYFVETSQIYDSLIGQSISVRSNVVEVVPPILFLVPNVINPMSLNEEDRYFRVQIDFVDDYELIIFDRYGRILFHSTNPQEVWDGRTKQGAIVPVDTYFYLLKFSVQRKKKKIRGNFSVIY